MSKILIIEDDREIAEIERDYLELDGFASDIASDGLSGLEKALNGSYDLILLDLMLLGMDGATACARSWRRIRQSRSSSRPSGAWDIV